MGDSTDFMDWAIRSEALDPEEDPMQDVATENPSSTTQVPLNQGNATRYCEGFTDGYNYAVDQGLYRSSLPYQIRSQG